MSISTTVNLINPTVTFVSRDQGFDFTIGGLLPLTTHYFYFERQLQPSTSLKPLGGKLGDPIITDKNGQVTFTYYFSSSLTSEKTAADTAQKLTENIVGVKEAVLSNVNTPSLSDDYKSSSLSYFSTTISINVRMPSTSEYAEIIQEENVLVKYVAPTPTPVIPVASISYNDVGI